MTAEPSKNDVEEAMRLLREADKTMQERSVQTALDLHRLRDALVAFDGEDPEPPAEEPAEPQPLPRRRPRQRRR